MICDLCFFLCFFRCVSPFCEVEQQLPLKNSIDILKEKKTNYPRQHDFFPGGSILLIVELERRKIELALMQIGDLEVSILAIQVMRI